MKCPRCKDDLPDGIVRCRNCGWRVEVDYETGMKNKARVGGGF